MRYKVAYPAENYMLLDFGNIISEDINNYVIGLAESINHEAVIEVVPAYSSILIEYDDKKINQKLLAKYIKSLKPALTYVTGREFKIPVVYGGEYGPDLKYVARLNRLTEEEVVKIHCSKNYRVYMLGFMPGFCYLGGMDDRIACERLEKPRLRIPKGSVGIAGMQTGIYPGESPGGWMLIGRTPYELYRPGDKNPFPIKAGDTIKFVRHNPEDVVFI